ncbi:uncharacterized protein BDW70DRAFT_124208 [Aspergillus foveolatus]|uniref:uncharacterized protein n=1 Tax=Aspergillus foveolatus TaxID=210207 RepID=UPI003CCCA3FF
MKKYKPVVKVANCGKRSCFMQKVCMEYFVIQSYPDGLMDIRTHKRILGILLELVWVLKNCPQSATDTSFVLDPMLGHTFSSDIPFTYSVRKIKHSRCGTKCALKRATFIRNEMIASLLVLGSSCLQRTFALAYSAEQPDVALQDFCWHMARILASIA